MVNLNNYSIETQLCRYEGGTEIKGPKIIIKHKSRSISIEKAEAAVIDHLAINNYVPWDYFRVISFI
ncbi:hypothetical protein COX95_01480 [bacterium CG_4_10_14_0_2_um_filter_33_32]|nr:MAG: hypothetical protein AUJ93_03795 [bacterium CG2_30_33_46]PIR67413.1 MAG: hypothetical protein COU50_03365 [bacterium CG10_big_fil_rev_8_21_14_0_10_33_18]PIU76301.1 MAG: hypothetical protein COS74_04745 [bacterium CG06_land_8_20_14_3_00_33_50]PIY85744.1 MAG: hypothetical protein COY76_00545 [bacterium CG_4_10_14_0_8_um_filter_33_57]PIZ86371.1 MAG: hypothetical protein COX95_01480 [bacterium CG_4_10_14_0_2_um_filter_33_32]PJA72635.1 MAG: hypothetical protein CO152_00360 [bacterium CG_4_9